MGKPTYHAKTGKFTSTASAHTVTRDGQRFLMVRSLRPMKTAMKDSDPVASVDANVTQGATDAGVAEAISIAKAKAALISILTASPGWIPVHECMVDMRKK